MAVEGSESLLNLASLFYYLCLEGSSLLGLHEVDDFFGTNLSVVDKEGVFHWVLIDKFEDFDTLDIVLFVD